MNTYLSRVCTVFIALVAFPDSSVAATVTHVAATAFEPGPGFTTFTSLGLNDAVRALFGDGRFRFDAVDSAEYSVETVTGRLDGTIIGLGFTTSPFPGTIAGSAANINVFGLPPSINEDLLLQPGKHSSGTRVDFDEVTFDLTGLLDFTSSAGFFDVPVSDIFVGGGAITNFGSASAFALIDLDLELTFELDTIASGSNSPLPNGQNQAGAAVRLLDLQDPADLDALSPEFQQIVAVPEVSSAYGIAVLVLLMGVVRSKRDARMLSSKALAIGQAERDI